MKTAELNVHRGRSIADVFEHALCGVRLIVRARRQSRADRDIPRPSAEAPDLFVDFSRVPDPIAPHRRRIDRQRQITMSEMLAAMMRAARSLAEKKAATRQLQRTRKRK